MNESNKSSYYYNTTPVTGTSNSTIWEGTDIPCLNICTGDRLTQVETNIATALCGLIDFTNTANIILPPCLITAWGTKDKTVLEFIQFLLDQACVQQASIDSISNTINNFNPLITVDYKCCSNNPCVTTGTVSLTQAFENVITCLCAQAANIVDLQTQINTNNSTINSYQIQLTSFQTQLTNFNSVLQTNSASLATHKVAINCLINSGSSGCSQV